MLRQFFIVIFIGICAISLAQKSSKKGRFSVKQAKGCVPFTVNIVENDTFGAITKQYYFIKDGRISNKRRHTYSKPGKHEIVQLIGKDGIDKLDTITVEAVNSTKPIIRVENCGNNKIKITNTDTNYKIVRIINNTEIKNLKIDESTILSFTDSTPKTIFIKGIYGDNQEICSSYPVEVYPKITFLIPKIISSKIKEICKNNFQLKLELSEFDNLSTYKIHFSQNTENNIIYEGKIKNKILKINNLLLKTNTLNYTLKISTINPCSNDLLESQPTKKTYELADLSPLGEVYSSYDSTGILIQFDSLKTGKINLYRKTGSEDFKLLTTTNQSFKNITGIQTKKYIYKLEYISPCTQKPIFETITSPPFIEANQLGENHYTIQITPETNTISSKKEIQKYHLGNPSKSSNITNIKNQFEVKLALENGLKRQYIHLSTTYQNSITIRSNKVPLKYTTKIIAPNAFTPNGDGLNDTFTFFGIPKESVVRLEIYNKWGNLIFSQNNTSPNWDGKYNGNPAPVGTYIYMIKFALENGEKLTQRGSFLLLKNSL